MPGFSPWIGRWSVKGRWQQKISRKTVAIPVFLCYTILAFIRRGGLLRRLIQNEKEVNTHEGRHPSQLRTDHDQVCLCGNVIETGSTKKDIRVEVCSKVSPFFTGKQKMVDTGGRVSRFNKFGLDQK